MDDNWKLVFFLLMHWIWSDGAWRLASHPSQTTIMTSRRPDKSYIRKKNKQISCRYYSQSIKFDSYKRHLSNVHKVSDSGDIRVANQVRFNNKSSRPTSAHGTDDPVDLIFWHEESVHGACENNVKILIKNSTPNILRSEHINCTKYFLNVKLPYPHMMVEKVKSQSCLIMLISHMIEIQYVYTWIFGSQHYTSFTFASINPELFIDFFFMFIFHICCNWNLLWHYWFISNHSSWWKNICHPCGCWCYGPEAPAHQLQQLLANAFSLWVLMPWCKKPKCMYIEILLSPD